MYGSKCWFRLTAELVWTRQQTPLLSLRTVDGVESRVGRHQKLHHVNGPRQSSELATRESLERRGEDSAPHF